MNCGVCGKPLAKGESQICDGCKKAMLKNKAREQWRYERVQDSREQDWWWGGSPSVEEESEDASAAWVDEDETRGRKRRR